MSVVLSCCSNDEQCCQLFLKVGLTFLTVAYLTIYPFTTKATFIDLAITLQHMSCDPPWARVNQVIVPIAAGEYGVIADHAPHVAQLKAGVLQILHEGTEKYDTSLQEVCSLSPILIPPQSVLHVVDSWASRVVVEIAGPLFSCNVALSEVNGIPTLVEVNCEGCE